MMNSGNFEIRQYLSDANQFLKDEFLSINKKRQNAAYSNLNMPMHIKIGKLLLKLIAFQYRYPNIHNGIRLPIPILISSTAR